MIDNMNEICAFSPFGGQLIREEVRGRQANANVPENTIAVQEGADRDMYVYVPASGCPDAKQAQVVLFLREGGDEQSAREAMTAYGLDKLAEEKHFILVFPSPRPEGWNYTADPAREDDTAFFSRCFMALPKSRGGVGGFIGMIFYLAATPSASAMALTMSAKDPLHTAGILLADLPAGCTVPQGAGAPQVAYVCGESGLARRYLETVNGTAACPGETVGHAIQYTSPQNPNVRHMISPRPVTAAEIAFAWERLFSETRRWSNDTYGTYQRRTNFTRRGFVAHVADSSLGVNGGYAHTWYEYVPPQLRGSREKAPLLFYFHGIGCVPLYGAEQSGWHDIADRENFCVVYPKPAQGKAWNIWDDPNQPSDQAFVLALIEHMKATYAIDESRIYISGFSMGAMMTNALASAYPDIFAAAAPCNGFHSGYLTTAAGMWKQLKAMNMSYQQPDVLSDDVSRTRQYADAKKAAYDYRMPIIQNAGLLDGAWPVDPAQDTFLRLESFDYWKAYNNIPVTPYGADSPYESGLEGDENCYLGEDARFLCHRWHSRDAGAPVLYELVLAKRMPHAVDLRQIELAWEFLKQFSRRPDGSLKTGG